ncbi:MAG: DUF1501 domain-containing protein, partial [Planctomycetaceae bacterium]
MSLLPAAHQVSGNRRSVSRRDVLSLASSLGLSFLLPALGPTQARARGEERPRSLITVWLAGGPSQLETWDPHPGTTIGGDTGAIDTRIEGLRIADWYPRMAEEIHHLNVIRSMVSKEGDHERGTYLVKTGYRPDPTLVHPSVGAILAHQLPNSKVQIPLHISLLPSQWPARGGFLGDQFDAFKVFDPQSGLANVTRRVEDPRQDRRTRGLEVVEQAFRRGRRPQSDATLHQDTVRRALDMMGSEQLSAFQVEREPEAVRAAYGRTAFGTGCLVARRLLEEGVRAIEVSLDGFDSHANNHEIQKARAQSLDPALAALVHDLVERDLFDSTILLCIGEFGRTPSINGLAGRDHWPTGFSCLVGGGGLQRGLVIGATDPTGERKEPADPIEVPDLYATILESLGVDYAREVITPVGRPMALCA